MPDIITSDCGTQFASSVWAGVCDLLHVKHISTTVFHPQANELVERFHRQLKDSLRAHLVGSDWLNELPWVLLALCAAPHEESAVSVAEALYGAQLVLPGQFFGQAESPSPSFFEDLSKSLFSASVTPHPHYTCAAAEPPAAPPEALMKAWMVLVWRDGHLPPLSPLYSSPYLVLHRSLRVFCLKIGDLSLFIALNRPIQWMTLVLPSPHTVDGLLGSSHSCCGPFPASTYRKIRTSFSPIYHLFTAAESPPLPGYFLCSPCHGECFHAFGLPGAFVTASFVFQNLGC